MAYPWQGLGLYCVAQATEDGIGEHVGCVAVGNDHSQVAQNAASTRDSFNEGENFSESSLFHLCRGVSNTCIQIPCNLMTGVLLIDGRRPIVMKSHQQLYTESAVVCVSSGKEKLRAKLHQRGVERQRASHPLDQLFDDRILLSPELR